MNPNKIVNPLESLEQFADKNKILILFLLLAPLFTHTFEMFSFILMPHDEAYAFAGAKVHALLLERWGAFLINSWIFPQGLTPFSIIYIIMLCILLGNILIFQIFSQKNRIAFYLCSFLATSFPTLYMILTYSDMIPSIGIAYLATSLSIFVFFSQIKFFYKIPLSSLLLAFAISCYQSFLTLSLAMFVFVILMRILSGEIENKDNFKNLYKTIATYFVVLIISLALFKAILEIFYLAYNVKQGDYIKEFYGFALSFEYFYSMLKKALQSARSHYLGSAKTYTFTFYALIIVFATSVLWIIVKFINKQHKSIVFTLFIVLIFSPFVLTIMGPALGDTRIIVAFPFVLASIIYISLYVSDKKTVSYIILTLTLIVIVQSSIINNRYSTSNHLAMKEDEHLTTKITMMLNERRSELNLTNTTIPIYFVGRKIWKTNPIIYKNATSWVGISYYETGHQGAITTFYKLYGEDFYTIASENEIKTIAKEIKSMPIWPHKNSVQIINGNAIVKFQNIAL